MRNMDEEKEKSSQDAQKIFNNGLMLHRNGEFYEAIKSYKKVIEINPNVISAWYNMGMAYQELGEYDSAIDVYKITLRNNPDFADTWYCLGVAYYKLGKRKEAINAYEKALKLDPNLVVSGTDNIRFNFLRLSEEYPMISRPFKTHFQFVDGTVEIEAPKFCPNCANNSWKRIIEDFIIKEYCIFCGLEVVLGRIHRRHEPSVVKEHWSGSRDDIEKILEKEYEKGKR